MRRRTEPGTGKQVGVGVVESVGQRLLPMVAGIEATKQGLMEWVHEFGLATLNELLTEDAERIAGPKGKHRSDRTHHHWGRTRSEVTFGGRRVGLSRPRLRGKGGKETSLPILERFRSRDLLSERIVNQLLLGVSTRGYDRSLEPRLPSVRSRGSAKSSVSRAFIARTRSALRSSLDKRLDDIDLLALLIDGVEVAGQTVVVALGITVDGSKVPLGLVQGSTENAALCTTLLQSLLDRGLRIEGKVLAVIDGGRGIRKALADVLGDRLLVQRCQVHKLRNLRDHLPEECLAYVLGVMRDAYRSSNVDTARKKLRGLVSWLENNGHDDAAASLREGLEETLTIIKLDLPPSLRRSLSTTNAIENTVGSMRRVARNVKRWKGGDMIRRWAGLGLFEAAKRFRRIKGYRELPKLLAVLRNENTVAVGVA